MKIKIDIANATKIEAALAAVNGKATRHAFQHAGEIAALASNAESTLIGLGVPKGERIGAGYVAQSGEILPSAYKYTADTTTVRLARGAHDWYLVAVSKSSLYPRQVPRTHLSVTLEQDAKIVAKTRGQYEIARPADAAIAA